MGKSSYQLLKEENKRLKEDIQSLLNRPESMRSAIIMGRHEFKSNQEKAGLSGARNTELQSTTKITTFNPSQP